MLTLTPMTTGTPAFHSADVLSSARRALLVREWPAGVDALVVLRRFNALPGPRIDQDRLNLVVRSMGLHRPQHFHWSRAAIGLPSAGDDEMIARHIAEKGVTRLPAAAAAPTTATLPTEGRDVLRRHGDALEAGFQGRCWRKPRKDAAK